MKSALLALVTLLFATASVHAADSHDVTPATLHARLKSKNPPVVIDVRDRSEFADGHIARAVSKPMREVSKLELPKDREIVLVCHSGYNSARALKMLEGDGFTNLWNLDGGMVAWEKAGFEVVK